MKESFKEGGYKYVEFQGDGQHLLQNTVTGEFEVWFSNKNHASYGLTFKNTHLEFARMEKF